MKHPTNEEIEDKIIERLKKINSKSLYEITREESQFLYGYERGFRESAKWARDQQPKLKTLDSIGWKRDDIFDYWESETEFGLYKVRSYPEFWKVVFPGHTSIPCDDLDHGKQLAQSDYERRINELYI